MNAVHRPACAFDLYPFFGAEEREPFIHVKPDLGVVHITVSPNRPGLDDILGVARYLDDNGLEIAAMVDQEANLAMSLVPVGPRQGLLHLAQYDHARGVNDRAIGIETVGYLKTRQDWWLQFAAQIDKTARFLAYCRADPAIDLPLVHLTNAERAAGKRGWIGHYQVPGTDHTDPGPGYPLTFMIETMARHYWQIGWKANAAKAPIIVRRPKPLPAGSF